ncbi:MAG: radical SAM family heme chaperone HemW [Phycisphaerales bacterium]|nr:radical SAM family heme chaperone HemW [Phycisphaerales bacterium]
MADRPPAPPDALTCAQRSEPIRALYVHVPFCRNICGYCDFYKIPLRGDLAEATVDALLLELDRAAACWPLALRSVFFGGGTPTELPPELLGRLAAACAAFRDRGKGDSVAAVRTRDPGVRESQRAASIEGANRAPTPPWEGGGLKLDPSAPPPLRTSAPSPLNPSAPSRLHPFPPSCLRAFVPSCLDEWEFTVEANPATITDENAGLLRAAGVNRVSMGAQSFAPAELRFLDRTHRPEQVTESVRLCRRHGFEVVNLDLIFGVPGQTVDSWRASLRAAVDLGVDHLSCYALTYEEGTTLHRRLQTGRVLQVENEHEAELYEVTMDDLAAAGFEQYEISNFARPGFECRHNLVYWHNEPHLAIGPSACGYIDGLRYRNVPDVRQYVEAIRAGRWPRASEERLDAAHRARETAMLALRLTGGLDRAAFESRFGIEPTAFFREAIERSVSDGLVDVTRDAIRLTRAGRLVGDSVMAAFLR